MNGVEQRDNEIKIYCNVDNIIREINNKNGKMKTGTLYTMVYIYSNHIHINTQTHTHNTYNIFCIYQYYPIKEVQLIY